MKQTTGIEKCYSILAASQLTHKKCMSQKYNTLVKEVKKR
ncbi:MAG: hypothetical protein JETT_1740 [Candidatus Jettenia ecosi]|uniref:Uncharacterized protein n=1 Tax=Candidatus Jettenia ecosi TaxID=2494326 RepID=A0A533QH95_9BACT|nr:MAG: hypothetical protein JETT_1740 [Candidatus Jettenia ecosi]